MSVVLDGLENGLDHLTISSINRDSVEELRLDDIWR